MHVWFLCLWVWELRWNNALVIFHTFCMLLLLLLKARTSDLDLWIRRPLPLRSWDYRCAPPYIVDTVLLSNSAVCILGRHSTHWVLSLAHNMSWMCYFSLSPSSVALTASWSWWNLTLALKIGLNLDSWCECMGCTSTEGANRWLEREIQEFCKRKNMYNVYDKRFVCS